MEFKGHQKSSFIDYPDKICTVLFTGGCNFRCPYCHNSDLVNNKGEELTEGIVLAYLDKRKKMIDAVCISGGEPTLHRGLYDFIKKIKDKDYLVKLDTNGTSPDILKKLISDGLLDYVAMDIKAPIDKYNKVTNTDIDINKIIESIDIVKNSDIDYEFRTTVCKELLTAKDIIEIAQYLKGSKRYYVQNFRDGATVLAGKNKFSSYDIETLKKIEEQIKCHFDTFKIRS
ncbi:anaerobic ribonucleoside-triphosphate reductase activating protein [Proteiniborus sp. MB09-C3]|uniref:anaerobic ribonucleoside-triphosphate reductase activating protein n=1 Tax=Proteiniborus sp. MB09-C3 TaxID=3050072 RepID=UPI002556D484|nr:anaerobic ribonucleoside-triphosphate reductase activating protein [Proteiniborus sp. MB09-C3]WIV11582.1 anaerobic ribonucleoside-triphosphate reductase activating protein [Proteiniborus sp. MB09-C3]